jgi:hypothetical protein
MKLSVTALATGAVVGTAALVSFAAVPVEAASSWSLSSLWNSASNTNAETKQKGSSMMTPGGTRLGRRAETDMDDGAMMMDGDEVDYSGLSAEEIAILNGDVDDNSETMMMNGGDMMDGSMSDGMDGMGSDPNANPANSNVFFDEQPEYTGPQDDEDQAEGMVGWESEDDQGEDPVAEEKREKQAALEAMDEQKAADQEFESDGAADLLAAEEEEEDHKNDVNAADPSVGTINRDEVETTDQIAKKDEESEAPALQGGVTIEALESGEVDDEVLNILLEDTIKEEAFPEQLQLFEEAASKDEMPAGPDEETKSKEQLEAGVQADADDEDDVADVPDGTAPTAEEPVPEGDNIKTTESIADEGLITDGKPDVFANAEKDGTDLEDLVANANAATEEAEAEDAPDGQVIEIDHLPTPDAVKELMEELGTPDIDLSVTGMASEYAESFGQWDEQDDPENEQSDEAMYEQQHMDEMADGTDPSMFTTTEGDIDDSDTDVARRRRRAAETTYTPV